MTNLFIRNSEDAFEAAIAACVLSTDPRADNYAGNFMYMFSKPAGNEGGDEFIDEFKHIDTRRSFWSYAS